MRPILPLVTAVIALVILLAPHVSSLGLGEPAEPGEYCPTYEVDSGEANPRLQLSTAGPWGALVLTVDRHYIVEDTFYANAITEPYTFSLWVYEESNGMPGLQRGDPVCTDVPPGVEADSIVNG